MARNSPFFDLPRLIALRSTLRELDPSHPPSFRVISPVRRRETGSLALLPGSFNPLTTAHAALLEAALASGRADEGYYVLASRTIDKERIEGASLADRLICLTTFAADHPGQGVMLVNRGLYVEQAEIVRSGMPALRDLWFVVGFDKILQIFDPRYYTDRAAALERLFERAAFLVAPRAAAGRHELDAFMARPENRQYADRVVFLDLAEQYRALSSTRIRLAARGGEIRMTEVPSIVARFIRETGAYTAPLRLADGEEVDRYALRETIIEAVEQGTIAPLSPSEFRTLLDRLTASDADGRFRRECLRAGDVARALS
ncbi:MAG: hypothetical protein IRY83_05730 [Chloroflexi bacterium]|nr:hypothetical protein [Chloroflexota bacterium]